MVKGERPILFTTEMVKAILKAIKNMTRRLKGLERINENPVNWICGNLYVNAKGELIAPFYNSQTDKNIDIKCPYGKPGDWLWVRETWLEQKEYKGQYLFKATCGPATDKLRTALKHKWKPSIHMPKAAARIWLKITEIGVERLQDISEEDAIAEGCIQYDKKTDWLTAKYGYEILWEKINGPDSWHQNPWVWVISFQLLSTNGRPIFRKVGFYKIEKGGQP